MTNTTWLQQPILVYGPRKAGTTLLQCLLDGGDHVLMLPGELKLKYMYLSGLLEPRERVEKYLRVGRTIFRTNLDVEDETEGGPRIVARGRFELNAMEPDQLEGRLDASCYLARLESLLADSPSDIAEMYAADVAAFERCLRGNAKSYSAWASKEVSNPCEAIVAHLKSAFPAAKFIFLARDPRFVVRSIILDRRRRGARLSLKTIFAECREVERLLSFFGRVQYGEDAILVRYEDLVQDTEGVMRRIARFLGIPFQPILTQPTILGQRVAVSTASKRSKEVFRDSLGSWRRHLTLRERVAVWSYLELLQRLDRIGGQEAITYDRL